MPTSKKGKTSFKTTKERLDTFQSFIDASPDSILYFDSNLKLIFLNNGVLKRFPDETKREDIIGKHITEIFPALEHTDRFKKYLKVLETGEPILIETFSPLPGLGDRFVSTQAFKIKDGLGFISRDITEIKKIKEALHETEQQYRTLFENIPIGLYRTTPGGEILTANPAFVSHLGFSSFEEMADKNMNEIASLIDYPRERYMKEVSDKNEVRGLEFQIKRLDGTIIHSRENIRVIRDSNGTIIYYEGSIEDITDRKKIEEALEEAKTKYRMLLEKQNEALVFEDNNGIITYANPRLLELVGYTEEELIGQHWSFIVHPDFVEIVEVESAKRPKGISSNYESCLRAKDGRRIPILISATPIFSDSGQFQGIQIFNTDITERKKMEEALRESEERYRSLVENIPIGIYRTTPGGKVLAANPIFIKHTGYSSFKELANKNINEIASVTGYPRDQFLKEINEKGEVTGLEISRVSIDGTVIHTRENARLVKDTSGKTLYFEGTIEDITEKKIMEDALRKSEERYRTLFENVPIGLYRTTPQGKILAANPAFLEHTGHSSFEELVEKQIPDLASMAGYPRDRFLEEINTKGEVRGLEFTLERKDGTIVHIRENTRVVKDSSGAVLYYEGTIEDISASKFMETAIINEKAKVETNLEHFPEGILLLDMNGDVYLVNQKFKSYFKKIYQQKIPQSIKGFKTLGNVFGNTISDLFLRKDKVLEVIEPQVGLYLELSSSIVMNTSEQPMNISIIVRDVSPYVEFENIRNKFVSTVSHELRAPANAIQLGIETLKKYRPLLSDDDREELLDSLERSTTVLSTLIEDLLVISRLDAQKMQIKWEKYYLYNVINEVQRQLRPILNKKNSQLVIEGSLETELYGDPKRVEQIIRILLDNAIKYSPTNSIIHLIINDKYDGKLNPSSQDGTLFQVVDKGRGIPSTDFPHLFERFFRASNVTDISGTGLGLTIAKELLNLHGGQIFVESDVKKGSKFSIFLPRMKTPPEIEP